MHLLVVIEQADCNYSAYSPDLTSCAATGKDRMEVEENIRAAIEMHIQGLIEDGLPVPASESIAEYITIKEEIGSG